MRAPCAGTIALLLASWAAAGSAQDAAEPVPAQTAPAPAAAPAARFAPSSVALAKRLTPQQREERRFLKEASAASRFEREAAHLALLKTGNAKLHAWAVNFEARQLALGNELQHLLQQRGMAEPMMANAHRHGLKHLSRLRGAGFDREFIRLVAVRGQRDDLVLFERAAGSAQDAQLKAWIEGKLPSMKEHLALAMDVEAPHAHTAHAVRVKLDQRVR